MMEEKNNLSSSQEKEISSEPVMEVNSVTNMSRKGWFSFVEKNFLALSILVAGFMISGSLIYANMDKTGTAQVIQDPQGNTKVDVSADDDAVLGNKNAKVTIIEFSDYQCPFCRSFWQQAYPQIRRDYIDTGKVKLVYRDYPLSFHPMAGPSAEAAECAREENKYWEMHDKIFAEQVKLGQGTVQYTNNDLKKWAGEIGLNKSQFNTCLDSGKYKTEVSEDLADGSAAGVTGTPSFFINGRLIVGAQPYEAFKTIIEEELNK